MASILVAAAHPDDEILGCGGALARHAAEGDSVHILIVAEGATSRNARRDPHGREPELAALRAAASRAADAIGAPVKSIYAFETVSSTEWQSGGQAFGRQRWVDIEPYLESKRRALDAYAAEMRPFPHAWSREAVEAQARGAVAGLTAAECFTVVREVVQ